MTALGQSLRRLYQTSAHSALTDWCQCVGVSYGTVRNWIRAETEPAWLRTLRTIKRRTGVTWGELLDGHPWERMAVRMCVSNHATDCATGHCECSACGGAIDPWDSWCRHCGARLEDAK